MRLYKKVFSEALQAIHNRDGRGTWAQIGRAAGVNPFTVAKNARGEVEPTLETWSKIHEAFPEDVPPPQFDDGSPIILPEQSRPIVGKVRNRNGNTEITPVLGYVHPDGTVEKVDLFRAPIIDLLEGEPEKWTHDGYPVGKFSDCIYMETSKAGIRSFGIKIHDDSMEPSLNIGAIAVVDRHAELKNGNFCFVRKPGEDWDKTFKKYSVLKNNEILLTDNKSGEPILLNPNDGSAFWLYKVIYVARAF